MNNQTKQTTNKSKKTTKKNRIILKEKEKLKKIVNIIKNRLIIV